MDFKKVTLGELSNNKGKYGIEAAAVNYDEELYTYLRITDICEDGTIHKEGLKSVVHNRAEHFLLKENDIVFARAGNNVGKNYFYEKKDGEFVYASFLIKFSLNPEKVNPRYIKYYCLSEPYKAWVKSHITGSTRNGINAKTFASMMIPLPARNIQDKIVKLLDSIENKRLINREVNSILVKMADVIFQQFVLSVKEYESGTLSDLIELKYGKPHQQLQEGAIPCYGSGGLMRYVEKQMFDGETVLIPRKGSLNNVLYKKEAFWVGETMFYSKMKRRNAAKYVYLFLKNKNLAFYNQGFVVPSMTKEFLYNMELKIPSEKELEDFDNKINQLYIMIENNNKENEKLLLLRNICFATMTK